MSTTVDDPRVIEFDVRTDEMLINMGPQHPSTHGVLRLALRTDGEIVSEVTPHLGYLHRCAEKIGENLTPRQWIPYTDRMDYLAGMNMNLGWSLTVEKLLKFEPEEKGRHLRVIIAEMGRIASHLVGMGAYGLDLGGATADLPEGWLQKCSAFLDQFEPLIAEYHTLLTTNAIFIARTAGIGVMSPEMAIDYGTSGPVLRGSGVDHDLRRDGEEIYTAMYDGYAFEVITEKNGHYPKDHNYPRIPKEAVLGDCWHRFYVRMLEVMQAIDLVRQAIERYSTATGSYGEPMKLNTKLPKGEVYLETESPRGQMGFYLVSDGTAVPWRVRARSSCFSNLSVTGPLCTGVLLADIPAIVGSLDIVMGEIDR